MRILVDINHPAHVHLFRHPIGIWREMGHDVVVVGRSKDGALGLLAAFGIEHSPGTVRRRSLVRELFLKTRLLYRTLRSERADIACSLASVPLAWAAWAGGVPHIAFEDTEHAVETIWLYLPATDVVCTPSAFWRDLGSKQVRYAGLHELSYLHPNRFTPDPSHLALHGLTPEDRFSIVRLVSWQASHDIGKKGLSDRAKCDLVDLLETMGPVLISAEGELPPSLQHRRFTAPPELFHHFLYYASLYVGEGGTVASEAAVLGTPSVQYRWSLKGAPGVHDSLDKEWGLLYRATEEAELLELVRRLLGVAGLQETHRRRRDDLISSSVDVAAWIANYVAQADVDRGRARHQSGGS